MTNEELLELAEHEPAVVDTTIAALKSVIAFREGRGAMLRSLRRDPAVAKIIAQLKETQS